MTKALVLSGGGSVGIGWQTGLLAGLARGGVHLGDANFIVGTSAGSAVGAQLALGTDLEARVAAYQQPSTGAALRSAPATGQGIAERMAAFMEVMTSADPDEAPEAARQRIGRFALDADGALPEEQFVAGFSYLADKPWPAVYRCTAVDAETGEFVVWDAASGAPLDRAVASSCAVPGIFQPITINGRRYIDGGMRSGANADLAAGHDLVVLVTLMGNRPGMADNPAFARMRARAEAELATITDAGGRIETIAPDAEAAAAMGMNLMDGSIAPAAAEHGVRQGEAIAEHIASRWS
jgi:NTE family protein